MITNPQRLLANNNPVRPTLACCMIPDEVEFRNKFPGGGVLGPHRELPTRWLPGLPQGDTEIENRSPLPISGIFRAGV
jgi:hypothetical protein